MCESKESFKEKYKDYNDSINKEILDFSIKNEAHLKSIRSNLGIITTIIIIAFIIYLISIYIIMNP